MIGLTSTLTRYMRRTRRNLDTRSRNRSRRPRARAAETGPREWQPFHLPFARGARELHLYLGDKFQHSASIPVDVTAAMPGMQTDLTMRAQSRSQKHVTTIDVSITLSNHTTYTYDFVMVNLASCIQEKKLYTALYALHLFRIVYR